MKILSYVFALLVMYPAVAQSQEDPVAWSVVSATEIAAGGSGSISVRAHLDSAWHVYGLTQPRPPIALKFEVSGDADVLMGNPVQPRPIRRFDAAFGIETEFFENDASFNIPLRVMAGARPGVRELVVAVHYQVCTDRLCLPPTTEVLPFRLNISAARTAAALDGAASADEAATGVGAVVDASADSLSSTAMTAETDTAPAAATPDALMAGAAVTDGDSGLVAYMFFAALMGLLALTTPCVFPMIPITVSYFTMRGPSAESGLNMRAVNIRDAVIYGGGIIAAFTGLGLLLALIYGATGISRFAANPWVNLMVASLFIAFALDLLGIWKMRLPWQVVSRVNAESQQRGGITGILLMGVAFAVTTFTCTVPFVGTLLVSAASGTWARPILGMLVFSSMFALPFFILALFPTLLRSLPKSGTWMGSFKVILGLIELGAALKFLSNADLVWQLGLLQRSVIITVWVSLAILATLHLLGILRLPFEPERGDDRIGAGRMLAGGLFAAVALFLLPGISGGTVGAFEAFLPPRTAMDDNRAGTPGSSDEVWLTSFSVAQTEAAASGRNIFVDFTGFTCTNCRWMESNVFTRGDVADRLDQYVLVRLYTDGWAEEYKGNQQFQLSRFGTVALPFYAILTPGGETIATFPGLTRKPAEFSTFLDQGLGPSNVVPTSGI